MIPEWQSFDGTSSSAKDEDQEPERRRPQVDTTTPERRDTACRYTAPERN